MPINANIQVIGKIIRIYMQMKLSILMIFLIKSPFFGLKANNMEEVERNSKGDRSHGR